MWHSFSLSTVVKTPARILSGLHGRSPAGNCYMNEPSDGWISDAALTALDRLGEQGDSEDQAVAELRALVANHDFCRELATAAVDLIDVGRITVEALGTLKGLFGTLAPVATARFGLDSLIDSSLLAAVGAIIRRQSKARMN